MAKAGQRHKKEQKQAQKDLAAASPESAAAAPLSEQPQQPEAALHQQEVLADLQVGLLGMLCLFCQYGVPCYIAHAVAPFAVYDLYGFARQESCRLQKRSQTVHLHQDADMAGAILCL